MNIFAKSRTIHHISSACQLGKSWLFVRKLSSTTHRAVLPSGAWVAVPSVWPCLQTKPGPKQNQALRLIWIARAPTSRPSCMQGEQQNMCLGFPAFGFLGFFLFRCWISFFSLRFSFPGPLFTSLIAQLSETAVLLLNLPGVSNASTAIASSMGGGDGGRGDSPKRLLWDRQ